MRIREIDADNDWQWGKGINNYKMNNYAIEQLIKTRLQSFLGDCFFATSDGIDWYNLLGSKNQVALNLAISATILKTAGVIGLVQLLVDVSSGRKITISYEVNTIYTGQGSAQTLISTAGYILTEAGDVLTTEDGEGLQG
jgi:hypothetical protein